MDGTISFVATSNLYWKIFYALVQNIISRQTNGNQIKPGLLLLQYFFFIKAENDNTKLFDLRVVN